MVWRGEDLSLHFDRERGPSEMFKEIGALLKGMKTTFKIMTRKKVTIDYPFVKKQRSARFRGRHILRKYDNGLEMCVGCELCQVACPANAITVTAAENDPEHPKSPGERFGYKYEIDFLRCIFCGMCEEACPTDCLHLTQEFELAAFSRSDLIYPKEQLLALENSEFTIPTQVYPQFKGRESLEVLQKGAEHE